MKPKTSGCFRSIAFCAAFCAALGLSGPAGSAICGKAEPWPKSSREPVSTLDHPTVEERVEDKGGHVSSYRFAVFGDQRALADGEWQGLIEQIRLLSLRDESLLFVLDTGDIVDDGRHSDQFHALTDILKPVSHLPYLVGVGNHEKDDNQSSSALRNTATFLSYLDGGFSPGRMYYRKDIGPARFLFLDTNDLVYGDEGGRGQARPPEPGSRGAEQIEWLLNELDQLSTDKPALSIAVMHHPILQSSLKHGAQAVSLWNLEIEGRSLARLLFGAGIDVILTGHTHTYERFRVNDSLGSVMHLINISGRPRGGFLWFEGGGFLWMGKISRRAADIAGRERSWLRRSGWRIPEAWSVYQEDAMLEREADQFAVITVEEDGGLLLEIAFLDDSRRWGLRWDPAVRIK